jgi:hypothetical protein
MDGAHHVEKKLPANSQKSLSNKGTLAPKIENDLIIKNKTFKSQLLQTAK